MITDAYTVQFLLEGTLAQSPSIVWRELTSEALGFGTRVGDVEISLTEIHARPAIRIGLCLRCGVQEYSLYEPLSVGWFGKTYASDAEADLAERLKRLLHAASQQCAQRHARQYEHPEELRERLYQRVLFGQPTESAPSELVRE
jgi:hypothetical protein